MYLFLKKQKYFVVPQSSNTNIKERLVTILKECLDLQHYKGVLNETVSEALITTIPLLIIKSLQILKTYPDNYKVVDSIVFNFIIPICYVTDEDLIARPLFINLLINNYLLIY